VANHFSTTMENRLNTNSASSATTTHGTKSKQLNQWPVGFTGVGILHEVIDCFGNRYRRIPIAGNGFCGFNSLSFCLTGTTSNYTAIIEDCINVFANCSQLFEERTNFGARGQTTRSVSDYEAFMRQAIIRIEGGESLTCGSDQDCWCEDGHLAAISLLYDIAIFSYHTETKKWYAFNETASEGYICLLSSSCHTEVLHGIGRTSNDVIAPAIPEAVDSQVVSRQSMNWTDAVSALQRNYALSYVWKWPVGFTGVRILNDAMLQPSDGNRNIEEPVSVSSGTLRKGFYCDVEGCKYGPKKNTKAIRMHKINCHKQSCGSQDKVVTTYKASTEIFCKDSSSVSDGTAVSVPPAALQTAVSSSVTTTQKDKGSEDTHLPIATGQQQCVYCSKWFKILANHKICHKRPAEREEDSKSKRQRENSTMSCGITSSLDETVISSPLAESKIKP
jgi:hypothetical protein